MFQPLSLVETARQTPKPLPQARPYSKLIAAVAAAAALLLLSLLYARVAQTVAPNSDNACIVLEAAAALHGNPWLHGWTLTNESFFTLDLPFYVIALAWHGMRPQVMREVPAVIYALTVLGAVWLAGRGPDRRSPWLGRAVTFALIGLPSLLTPQVLLVGVDHVATTLAMVGGLIALDVTEGQTLSKARQFGLGVLCLLLVMNDPMGVALFIAPVVIVSLVRCLRGGATADDGKKHAELALAAGTMASVFLAGVFLKAIHMTGGFRITPLALKIVPLTGLPTNALVLFQGLLSLFRADIFGEGVNAVTVGFGIDLLALGLVLWGMVRVLCRWRDWHSGRDRVAQVVSVAMALNLAAVLFDKAVFDLYTTLASPAERYLIPFFVLGAVLAGRFGIDQIGSLAWRKLTAGALGVIAAGGFIAQLQMPPAEERAAGLARWLAARGLKYGYGNYWCSSIVTAESGGAVRVRPVEADGDRVAAKHWVTDERWYRSTPAHFLVYDICQSGRRCFYFDDVSLQTATRTFGPPTEVARTDGYTILIWDKNITPDLKR